MLRVFFKLVSDSAPDNTELARSADWTIGYNKPESCQAVYSPLNSLVIQGSIFLILHPN